MAYAEWVPVPGAVVVRFTVAASTGGGVAAGGVADAVVVVRSRVSTLPAGRGGACGERGLHTRLLYLLRSRT